MAVNLPFPLRAWNRLGVSMLLSFWRRKLLLVVGYLWHNWYNDKISTWILSVELEDFGDEVRLSADILIARSQCIIFIKHGKGIFVSVRVMKAYGGSERISAIIPILGTGGEELFNFTPRPLCIRGKGFWHTFSRGMSGPFSWCGCFGVKRWVSFPCQESKDDSSVVQPLA
jgi:hypothetical protein